MISIAMRVLEMIVAVVGDEKNVDFVLEDHDSGLSQSLRRQAPSWRLQPPGGASELIWQGFLASASKPTSRMPILAEYFSSLLT
jgi:hypothetical protein